MALDVIELRDFYARPLGRLAGRLIGRRVDDALRPLGGRSVLGLGYAEPYLPVGDPSCGRNFAFAPAGQGVAAWPTPERSAVALVDPTTMPLPDESMDVVLAAHAIENADNPSELLHEVWRILRPGGRLVLVCPNRRGLWARADSTPFGQGQPFSRPQLRRLLVKASFQASSWAETLYVPPVESRFVLSGAAAWESVGAGLRLPFSGIHVVDAAKEMQRPIPIRSARRARASRPVLVPAPVTT